MFVRVSGERQQRFHFADRVDPLAQLARRASPPGFRRIRKLQREEQWDLGQAQEDVVARVGPVGNRAPGARCRATRPACRASPFEPLRERRKRRLFECLDLDLPDHVGQ